MTENNQEPKNTDYGQKIFFFGLEIAFWFGIPAFLGLFLGKYLDQKYGDSGNKITAMVLLGTFIFSWTMFIYRLKSIEKKNKKANLDKK